MTKRFLLPALVLCFASFWVARAGLVQRFMGKLLPSQAGPVIDVVRHIDLGRVETEAHLEAAFTVHNKGGTDLCISKIQTNCGCQGVFLVDGQGQRVKPESFCVSPLRTVELRMPFIVDDLPGIARRRFVRFQTNDPASPSVEVDFSLTADPSCRAIPVAANFLNTPVGEDATFDVQLVSSAGQPRWTIERLAYEGPSQARAIFLPPSPGDKPRDSARAATVVGTVRVTVAPEACGETRGQVLVYASQRDLPLLRIPIRVVAVPLIGLYPSEVSLPRFSGKGPVYMANCICKGASSAPLEVCVTSPPPGVAVQVLDVPGNTSYKVIGINCAEAHQGAGGGDRLLEVQLEARQAGKCHALKLKVHLGTGLMHPEL